MKKAKLKIVLVMHNIPLDSGFLAAKFIKLAEEQDIHMLAWDKKENIDQFIERYKLPADYRKRIQLGANTTRKALMMLAVFFRAFITNQNLRGFLFSGEGHFGQRLKFIFTYLPAICLKPDIIHFEFGTLARTAVMLRKTTMAKLSASFRGYDLNYAGLDNTDYYEETWDMLDGVHFLGNDLKQRAIKRGYKENKTEAIIPPAIDTSFFTPSSSIKDDSKLIITSVGRLVWKKGYEYGIRAVKLLKDKNIPFEYRIIGGGEHKQALQFAITELGLQNEVLLLGNLNTIDIKPQLSEAHIFLHPSISEGFSNAVLEAQAMGIPVITSDADGLPENVEDGVTGFITPKWDVEAIAEKLIWFWDHKGEMKTMGDAGIKRVNAYFRQSDQINTFIQFYENLYRS